MASLQGRGMAAALVMVMVLVSTVHYAAAVEFQVGDRSNWSLPSINYNQWAISKRIRVNDELRFMYSSEVHNVLMVTKAEYDQCSAKRPVAAFADGNTVVRLSKRGTYYFICGVPGHCQSGMKMQVFVH